MPTVCVKGPAAWVPGLGEVPGPPAPKELPAMGEAEWTARWAVGRRDVVAPDPAQAPTRSHTHVPGRHSPEGGPLTVLPPRYPCPSALALLAGPQLRPPELPDAFCGDTGPGTPGDREGFTFSRKLNRGEGGMGPAPAGNPGALVWRAAGNGSGLLGTERAKAQGRPAPKRPRGVTSPPRSVGDMKAGWRLGAGVQVGWQA